MLDYLDSFLETWGAEDTVFILFLSVTFLVTLYILTLLHRKLRLIESEIMAMRKDQSIINEELEMLAQFRKEKQGTIG